MDGEWEISGTTSHKSLAAAQATARWLGSQAQNAAWEFAAATLDDGSHRVLRRRATGRAAGGEREHPTGRPDARTAAAIEAAPWTTRRLGWLRSVLRS